MVLARTAGGSQRRLSPRMAAITMEHSLLYRLRARLVRDCRHAPLLSLHLVVRAAAALCVALLMAPRPVLGEQPISQRIHTAWRSRDGAPANIKALAQAADGMLWIGSQWGLFNFDGKTFASIQSYAGSPLPGGGVASLLTSRDGALWVGYTNLAVVRIHNGTARIYQLAGAAENDWVVSLQQGRDGTIWCATANQLLRLQGDAFAANNLPPRTSVRRFVTDNAGNDWLGTQEGLLERPLGRQVFAPVPGDFGIVLALTALPQGGVLVADYDLSVSRGRTQRLDDTGKVTGRLPGHDVAYDAMIDQDGAVWLATQTTGLRTARWTGAADEAAQPPDRLADAYGRADGLTSNGVFAVLQDRDGNIWAGTKTGLDRFRLAALAAFSSSDDASTWFVCSDLQGDVWIANTAGKLYRLSDNATMPYQGIAENVSALGCGRRNDAWFATPASFWHAVAGRVQPVPKSPGFRPHSPFQLQTLNDGAVLANASAEINDGAVWRLRDGAWSGVAALQQDGGVQKVFADPSDRLWVIPRNHADALDLVQDGKAAEIRTIPAGLGRAGPIIASSFGFLLGGRDGLALSTGGDFHTLSISDPALASGVSGLVQARNGDIWFISSRGIVQLAADQISKAISNPGLTIQANSFQENDFVGRNGACSCSNAAARGSDGKLWFAGLTGIVSIDPAALPPQPHPPVLLVKSMLADDRPQNARREFAPNPHTLRIAYAGINLSDPNSVIYRYRLEGFDKTWQDVGRRTEATYTSLRPGSYTFQLMASNGDGKWTRPIMVPLIILPSFYQTYWFIALGSVSVCAFLWGMQSLYVRNLVALTKARADARAEERIRISQDIHDTLLQGVQGLLLHVHVATKSVPQDHPSAPMLERALSAASRIIVEGRESVSALRSTSSIPVELVSALEQVGRDLNVGRSIGFHVRSDQLAGAGAQRFTLTEQVADQVFSAAREAISNAFQHAQASRISVVLSYSRRAFTFHCTDNGVGFAIAASQGDRNRDHWGIHGMRERVAALGGKLELQSKPMQGTVVAIVIPASRAYRKSVWWRHLPLTVRLIGPV